MLQDTLQRRIDNNESLTEHQIESALIVFGKGCQQKTKDRLSRALSHVPDINNYGIFGRVHIKTYQVVYCAGQSYTDEIRTVRECLIAG